LRSSGERPVKDQPLSPAAGVSHTPMMAKRVLPVKSAKRLQKTYAKSYA